MYYNNSINNNQIITSILDNDIYKFCMQQAIFHNYKKIKVKMKFYSRDENNFGKYSNSILEQIKMMENVRLTIKEFYFLQKFSFFKIDYLNWLYRFSYNTKDVVIYNKNRKLYIEIEGLWCNVILWETPLLSIISEIILNDRYPNIKTKFIIDNLNKKIKNFYYFSKKFNISKFYIVDFGTRRRFSKKSHYKIVSFLTKKFPNFIGTSNLKLSEINNIPCLGTQSHEWYQVHQQIVNNIVISQKIALYKWLKEYPKNINIALTDCINTDVFLKDFDFNLSRLYNGVRNDSGDPIVWANKIISHYKKFNIKTSNKILVFSNNLNFKKSLFIYLKYFNKINLLFAIGTNLTCDIPNVKPLNIVIKVIKCNDMPVAKISDSFDKIVCCDKSFLIYIKKIFNIK
ncbi:MAG: nicotinate phosphoribosyltransferase [Enterobacteriaceae bacterium]